MNFLKRPKKAAALMAGVFAIGLLLVGTGTAQAEGMDGGSVLAAGR